MADFKIPIAASRTSIFAKMKAAVEEAKGELSGNEEHGSFRIPIALGTIEGQFSITNEVLEVTVTKKPMLVSRKMIKQALEDFLED